MAETIFKITESKEEVKTTSHATPILTYTWFVCENLYKMKSSKFVFYIYIYTLDVYFYWMNVSMNELT